MRHTQRDRAYDAVPTPALLDAASLEKSQVVANACMNRERNLAGENSYERDLGLAPLTCLNQVLEKRQEASWLDLCCGSGRALIQAAEACHATGLEGKVKLTGVDLVPMFKPIPRGLGDLRLVAASVADWETTERFDLVTCVHGLHYIGDKLGLLWKAAGWLRDGGLLTAHLDYRNMRIEGRTSSGAQIGKDLRRAGFRYVAGRHLLSCVGQGIPRRPLPYRFLGADDRAGPNYTRQPAVDSYYERIA
jgi:SAM-dependent methyltransferase